MLSQSDQPAVARCLRQDDRAAWTSLYDTYCEDVWRYAARLIGSDEAAVADVVQEVFLGAAQSATAFDPSRGTLWVWLSGIVHHRVAAYWRERNRLRRLREALEAAGQEVPSSSAGEPSVEQLLERQETADLVRYVLTQVSADYAALLTGKYLDDCSLEVLAQRLGASPEAVKSKLARARQEFRSCFERCSRQLRPLARPS